MITVISQYVFLIGYPEHILNVSWLFCSLLALFLDVSSPPDAISDKLETDLNDIVTGNY